MNNRGRSTRSTERRKIMVTFTSTSTFIIYQCIDIRVRIHIVYACAKGLLLKGSWFYLQTVTRTTVTTASIEYAHICACSSFIQVSTN